MAITIRNKTTEELIRKIGRRTGEGPSAVVRRLAEREAGGHAEGVSEEELERRLEFMRELSEKYPPPDPKPAWEEIQRDIDALYDYLDDDPRDRGK